ncbi:MAG: efflux RND transporter periplasmic adaptor subunit [Chloroflexi bacterium]|nr:efflux RND transporter periplasmic adaptor subunit [Chloroflexota bacterium]
MKRIVIGAVILVILLTGVAAVVFGPVRGWLQSLPVPGLLRPAGQTVGETASLAASGAVETEAIAVSSSTGGRLSALSVAEGDQVAVGDLIAEIDTALADADLTQARAAVAQTEAQVALLKAGARPADVEILRAALQQAQVVSATASVAWQDAQALVTAPRDLDVKLAGAEAAIPVAEAQLQAAQARATAADLEEALWGRIVKLLQEGFDVALPFPGQPPIHFDAPADRVNQALLQWNQASQRTWQAHAQADIAAAGLATAHQTLADLRAQKADPQSLQAQANAAEAAYRMAAAGVATAQANLDLALAGVPAEQIQAAEALVRQAQGGVQTSQVKRDQARILAPQAGTVTAVVQRRGEVVAAGSPIVRLADLRQVTLTVYVPEPQLGRVRLGQAVQVAVDAFSDRFFPGAVTQVASQAEFTPRNIQTRQERANTVFAVKITLANPDGVLKPGMPADAYFCAEGQADCRGGGGQASVRLPSLAIAQGQPVAVGPLRASGAVEGVETAICAELGGRVVEVAAVEGDRVAAGQVLIRLDGSELEARRSQAIAAVTAATADLARVTAKPQPARVAQTQAQVAQAEAALAGARAGLADARKLRDNPLDLDTQINNAQAQVQAAASQIDLARANLKASQVLQESVQPDTGSDIDRTKRAIYDQQVAAADALVRAAQAQQQSAQAALAQLLAIRHQPVALDAAVHKAEGQALQASTSVTVALASLAQVQASAQPEAVALAQNKVAQAEAAVALLDATLGKLWLSSPVTGTVASRMIHVGEVAQPGMALLTLVDLSQVKLAIYVPASQIGQVKLGQTAQVTVDAYPGRQFAGRVTHIADQAEFTPKNIQTQEERVKTVFRVEIALENPDAALKPGMPADAVLVNQGP